MVAPKVGDAITQSDLLSYLFVAPQTGDWLRYRVSVNDNLILTKTIGFGSGSFRGQPSAFFEIQTQNSGLVASPVASQSVAGGTIVWKMFVDATNFDDSTRQYAFRAGIIKIGDSMYRLGGNASEAGVAANHQSLLSMLLFGLLPLPDNRSGTVVESRPETTKVGRLTLPTVHTIADFPSSDVGIAAGLPQESIETWQTSDVPLGLVTIRVMANGNIYSVDLSEYGHATYHPTITQDVDSVPYFPGT